MVTAQIGETITVDLGGCEYEAEVIAEKGIDDDNYAWYTVKLLHDGTQLDIFLTSLADAIERSDAKRQATA